MWVPIALSRDIPKGTTRAVLLEAEELVVWRGEGGSVQVWEDRCPHRGMRLSFGFVRGDALNCLYHGWEYGAGASCRRIPAHPGLTVPSTIRANAYAATETGSMVFVDRNGNGGPPPVVLAGLPVASHAVAAPAETLFQLVPATPHPDAQLVEVTLDGVRLHLGWHVPGPGRIMLHAVALDPGVESRAVIALHKLRAAAERTGSGVSLPLLAGRGQGWGTAPIGAAT